MCALEDEPVVEGGEPEHDVDVVLSGGRSSLALGRVFAAVVEAEQGHTGGLEASAGVTVEVAVGVAHVLGAGHGSGHGVDDD